MPLSPQSKLATGTQGMISSAHPMATKVGLMILQRGGNAFDAAVAIAAALNVVEPMNSGIGGYGTILLYQARQRKCRFLNSSSRIPMNVESDRFRPPAPNFEANRRGAMAISTPGNVRGWQVLSEVYGNLPWADLLQPAIHMGTSQGYKPIFF
jgi:gamma-glutamyltranspeptidase/glutathione hydrolase